MRLCADIAQDAVALVSSGWHMDADGVLQAPQYVQYSLCSWCVSACPFGLVLVQSLVAGWVVMHSMCYPRCNYPSNPNHNASLPVGSASQLSHLFHEPCQAEPYRCCDVDINVSGITSMCRGQVGSIRGAEADVNLKGIVAKQVRLVVQDVLDCSLQDMPTNEGVETNSGMQHSTCHQACIPGKLTHDSPEQQSSMPYINHQLTYLCVLAWNSPFALNMISDHPRHRICKVVGIHIFLWEQVADRDDQLPDPQRNFAVEEVCQEPVLRYQHKLQGQATSVLSM